MVTEANPVLDALLQPQELDMSEIIHGVALSAEKDCEPEGPFGCGSCVDFPPAFLLSAAAMTLGADDRRLSSAAEIGRSVRKNPKDSGLGKLRAPQIVERENVLHEDRVPDGT
jgi:hypothetical protein